MSSDMVALNMRIDPKKRDLIDRAVAELGGCRTSFIVESACERAKDVLLSQMAPFIEKDIQ